MKLVRWVRFTWELEKLPAEKPPLSPRYQISAASPELHQELRQLVLSAFHLDVSWNDAPKGFHTLLESHLAALFEKQEMAALVVTHGKRVVCASVFSTAADAPNHLLTGPCLLREYSNRGLGAAMLYHTLAALKDAGLSSAHGITKTNTTAAKFVYSKFRSTHLSYDHESEMAGS